MLLSSPSTRSARVVCLLVSKGVTSAYILFPLGYLQDYINLKPYDSKTPNGVSTNVHDIELSSSIMLHCGPECLYCLYASAGNFPNGDAINYATSTNSTQQTPAETSYTFISRPIPYKECPDCLKKKGVASFTLPAGPQNGTVPEIGALNA
ncbi:hypothetical protein BC936DRAFT_138571 [Jimgerdemannia flammicorona]|uniref:Uncharacterized protein n=1 Tax=Jimgerdemannia flammicorona TaxID=994334 RepID=A0A433C3H1_9FUNG|nr:hypothetical protein BC936DRAFT_138571 [Jimgerdemannia flammicorona]